MAERYELVIVQVTALLQEGRERLEELAAGEHAARTSALLTQARSDLRALLEQGAATASSAAKEQCGPTPSQPTLRSSVSMFSLATSRMAQNVII